MSKAKVVAAGALLAAAGVASFVKPWEGRSLTPYRDVVGVWTVCEGITRNVEQRRYTHAECDALLRDEVAIHLRGVAKCINVPLKENEWVAVGSWTYNVGVGAACGSSLVRKINAGQPASVWCADLLRWNRAGGRVVRGLTLRRQAEYKVCIGE
jgi:lysozyme